MDLTAGVAYSVPTVTAGASGFGGSPTLTVSVGGKQVGDAASAGASQLRSIAAILTESGGLAATMGSYQRRHDEWTLQADLANAVDHAIRDARGLMARLLAERIRKHGLRPAG